MLSLACLVLALTAVAGAPPAPEELESAIAARLTRIEPFVFLKKEAEKLGVRVWLFGGTAAAYAHYVKWDLAREKGELSKTSGGKPQFQKERFDYDYTNIYRSTQDLDIVVDGSEEDARHLEAILKEKFPHLQGSKSAWEVRLLKTKSGDKDALLDNPDFLNQHTDSNSTGLIEVTKPPRGQSVIRDLRDWKNPRAAFFEDVRLSKLHYYFSDKHETTPRFKQGKNPPIFSAIRYLIKAFQYELSIEGEDLERIRAVVGDFNRKRDLGDAYATAWIIKNAKKLFQNAIDIEYAWKVLDDLGLRQKLIGIDPKREVGSLSWWMNKEPLRSFPVGEGTGKTARQLGITTVAHETSDFLAYESITRSHKGVPNVFISRRNQAGEGAAYGDGFYTAVGRTGMKHTGLTIRFTVDPDARNGVDFSAHDGQILFHNRNALRIIPESMSVGPLEYFRIVSSFDTSDKGILEKLRRRVGSRLRVMEPKEEKELFTLLRHAADHATDEKSAVVLREWFSFPDSARHPEILWHALESPAGTLNTGLAMELALRRNPHWQAHPDAPRLF